MGWGFRTGLAVALALTAIAPARAQDGPAALETVDEAIARDAAAMASRLALPGGEARRVLRLSQASVPATEAIAARFADRLAGIAVDFGPTLGVSVLLTGDAPVSDERLLVDGEAVPVTYRTGAPATRTGLVAAITAHQSAIRASLIAPPGMGVDQRTGELVIVVSGADVAREGADALHDRLATLAGVPVRLRVVDQPALDMGGIAGGERVVGSRPGDPRRYVCTAGFVVTDGTRTALATAAHCADTLTVRDVDGTVVELPFVGQWGWGYQDVQINASPAAPVAPVFRADTAKTVSRPVTAARSRDGTRAGDVVCHRGERTGYSCSQVELTDFAPAGDLCGGACLPTWTTVAGPACGSGDSGSPVFLGTTAYGILKGGSYRGDGSCAFYFYMSTDYLPAPWRLLMASP